LPLMELWKDLVNLLVDNVGTESLPDPISEFDIKAPLTHFFRILTGASTTLSLK